MPSGITLEVTLRHKVLLCGLQVQWILLDCTLPYCLVNMCFLPQSVQFDVRPGVCVSGASPESVSRLLGELAQYGTYYLRLGCFSLQSADKKGLVFQVYTVCWYNHH